LLIIVAPLQILLGTIVQGSGFGSWLKSMVANLSVYPIVGFLFVLSFLFLRAGLPGENYDWNWLIPFDIQGGFIGGQAWDPPLTFGTGEAGTRILWLVVSFGILAMIPKVAEIISSLIKGQPFAYGTAITEPLKLAAIPASSVIRRAAMSENTPEKLRNILGFISKSGEYTGALPRE
jgi:hypothetical protein